MGQYNKAKQCLKKSHQLSDRDPETIKDIGNAYLSLGKLDEANKWYEKSIDIDNYYAPAINNLADIKKEGTSRSC